MRASVSVSCSHGFGYIKKTEVKSISKLASSIAVRDVIKANKRMS